MLSLQPRAEHGKTRGRVAPPHASVLHEAAVRHAPYTPPDAEKKIRGHARSTPPCRSLWRSGAPSRPHTIGGGPTELTSILDMITGKSAKTSEEATITGNAR